MAERLATEPRLLAALDELGRGALAETDLVRLARLGTAVIKESLGLVHVALALVDLPGGVAEYLAEASDYEVMLELGDTQRLDRGVVGRCAREGRSIYVADVRSDPAYVEVIPGIVAELAVPVIARGRVVAVLNCETREPERLRGKETFLELAAARIGVAIENARLLREREEALAVAERRAQELLILNEIARIAMEDLELRPMLQRITDAMARMFDWEFVACASIDGERRAFTCEAVSSRVPAEIDVGYGRELGSGVVGEVALSGRPVLIDDVRAHGNYVETLPGCQSELCVPVVAAGRVVAVINLESTKLAAFHDQLPVLETIAEQVNGAIASARLYEELRKRAGHLEMLGEVSREAMEATDLPALLDRIVGYVQQRFDLALAGIVLVDEEREEIELVAHRGELPASVSEGSRWPKDAAGIAGRAIRTGVAQLQLDVRDDPDYIRIRDDVVAEFAVPIRFQGRVLGVMNLESRTAEVFSRENLAVMRTLVDQVAGAIHMAATNKSLAERNRVLRDLFSRYVAPDVAEMLIQDPERFSNHGERRAATVLFADIRGFTRMAQRLASDDTMALLNEYFTSMGEAIFCEKGSVNLIVGDGLMAVFGMPTDGASHAEAAVRAAHAMHRAAHQLSPRWERMAGAPLRIVVAINTGDVVVGNIGDPRHMQFTVLGDVVNVAARLEAEAKQRDVATLVSGAVFDELKKPYGARDLGRIELRGREGSVRIYELP